LASPVVTSLDAKLIAASADDLQAAQFFASVSMMGPEALWKARLGALTLCIISGLCASGCGAAATGDQAAGGTPMVTLQNRPTADDPLLAKAKDAPPDKVLNLELEFALRNKAEFDQLINEINDPKSPQYQKWMTPEQMHARFGESQAEFNAVEQWLQAQGFTITDKAYGTNEDYIRFTGTVAQADKAFNVRIAEPTFEEYVPRQSPQIPAQFAGVIARVNGLDNVGYRSSDNN